MIDSKKTKKQLIEELERYRRLFDNAPLGYQSLDISGNFIEVNDTWCRTLGYARGEIIGRNFSEFLHPDFREHFKENFPKFKSMGYILGVEFEMIKTDGTEIIVSFNGRIGYNEDGSFRQTHCMLSDITERKLAESQREDALEALEESEERFREVLASSPDAIMLFDPESRKFQDVNKAAVKLYGYSREEFLNLKHDEITAEVEASDDSIKELLTKKYFKIPLRYHKKKDGTVFPVEISGSTISLKSGNVVCGIIRDITERKLAEEELREKEETLRALLNAPTESAILIDPNGTILAINGVAAHRLDKTPDELIGLSIYEYFPRDLAISRKAKGDEVIRTGLPVRFEDGRDGRIFDVNIYPIFDAEGAVKSLAVFARDITEQMQAKEALKKSERRLSSHLQNTPIAVIEWNLDFKVIEWNTAAEKTFGYTKDEAMGRHAAGLIVPESAREHVDKVWGDLLENKGGLQSTNENSTRDGRTIVCDWNNTPLIDESGKVCGVASLVQDITERKLAEDELKASERRFATLVESAPIAIYETDAQGKCLYVNERWRELAGMTQEDALGDGWKEGLHKEDRARLFQLWKDHAQHQKPWDMDYRFCNREGKVSWVIGKTTAMRDEDGRVTGYLGANVDITDRKLAEEALKNSEEKLRTYISAAPDAIFIADSQGRYVEVNRAACNLTGYSESELTSMSIPDIIGPETSRGLKNFEKLKETGVGKSEFRLKRKDGSIIIASLDAVALPDDRFMAFCSDITERKLAVVALKESEEKYRNLVETSQDLIWKCDAEGRFTYLNPAWEKTHGYTVDEMLGKGFGEFQRPEIFERDVREFSRHLAGGSVKGYETTQIAKDGRELTLLFNAIPLYDSEGNVVGTQGTAVDITERKRAEMEIEAQQYYLSKAQEIGNIGTWELDILKNKLIWTEENYRIFGVPLGTELNYEAFLKQVHPDDREYVNREWKAAIGGKLYDIEHRLVADGEIKWVREKAELNFDKDGQAVSAIGFTQDITQRKQAQEALQASEERFRTQMVQSPLVMEIYDLDGLQIEVNKAYEKLWGFPASTTVNKFNVLKSKEVEDTGLMKYVKRAYAGEAVTVPEYEFDPSGETESGGPGRARWLSTKIYPLKNSSGNVTSIVISHEDITDRKQAEYEREVAVEALRESEEKHRSIAERIYDVIIVARLDGEISYVSPSVRRVFGYHPKDLVGKKITEFVPEAEIPHLIETFQLSAAGGDVEGHHSEFLKKDGSYASIELNAVPIYKNDKIIGAQAIIRDITETKRLQELESRAERLEMAGTIAGQVAHDFNNLLAPIMAYPEFIHDELPHDNKAHAYLDAIEEAAIKIADINQDLLTMGRRGHYNLAVLDINRVVLHAAKEMESRTKTVAVELKLCKDIEKIKGGSAQIHRMLTNLLVNAQDAMEDIGKVTIRTENYYADDTSIAFGRVPKGEYVKLTVSDTGCGIPDELIHKILDPFFTSKTTDKKRGSGLGLSVVDAVIRDHKGYLDLSTRPGVGTSFYIYFPITHDTANDAEVARQDGGTEKVLVIDDDAIQRDVSFRLLKKLGYEVTTIESGEKGVEFIKNNRQDLVILDMIMPPGIDGTETYRRILKIYPEQKAIFVSGFSETDRILEGQKMGVGAFIKKPLTKKAIASAVRRELDRERKITVN